MSDELRILIAEDVDLVAEAFSALLETEPGFQVVAKVSRGDEVVAAARAAQPDIALLDIDMPEVDGMKALADIRAMDPTACVVMVSAIGSLAAVKQALGFGAAGFVVKPFSAQRVYDVLKRFAESTGNPALLRGD